MSLRILDCTSYNKNPYDVDSESPKDREEMVFVKIGLFMSTLWNVNVYYIVFHVVKTFYNYVLISRIILIEKMTHSMVEQTLLNELLYKYRVETLH